MDAVSYSKAAQQATRIGKIINEPDATSGLVTLPSTIAVGETITIPVGRTVVHPNLQVNGTLNVQGTLFIPSGGVYSPALINADVVQQGGLNMAVDSTVVHKTGDETIAGVKTFSDGLVVDGATITALRETRVAMGANNIDLATGNVFTKTITAITTFTVSNVLASGNANSFILELTNGGAYAITWFTGVKWAGGVAPVLTASGVDIVGFYSHDGGTTYRGILLAKDSK